MIAIFLCIEMGRLLIRESAAAAPRGAIDAAVVGTPGVVRLIHSRTQHLGPEEILPAAVPEVRAIYIEPDLYRSEPVG